MGEWRGQNAYCAHLRDALHLEPAFARPRARYDVRELYPDSHTTDASPLGVGGAVDLLDDSPTVRLEHRRSCRDDQLATRPDPAVTVPATKRFAAWSRRYLILVASADALVGGLSAAIPASISNTLSGQPHVVPLLCLVGLIVWPAAIAMCRGYRRNRIGIGFDEPGAVIRAGMVVVVAGALPAGFMAVPSVDAGLTPVRVAEAGGNRHSIRRAAQPAGSLLRPQDPASDAAPRTQPPTCRRRRQLRRGTAAQRTDSTRAGCRHESDRPLPTLFSAAQARRGRDSGARQS